MSRHKLIRNLDLDDELDDVDGGADYDYDGEETSGIEELSEEDQEQMNAGTIAVRAEIGDVPSITDKAIHDSLWHYYYDVGKTVEYLLNKAAPPVKKEKKKKVKDALATNVCETPFVPAGFWSDMAWLNVPQERRTTFIAPLYPRGGLLGGSSEPKMSKLQALAAARKKKAQEKSGSNTDEISRPLADLSIDRLPKSEKQIPSTSKQGILPVMTTMGVKERLRTYPERKRKNSSPHEKTQQPLEPTEIESLTPELDSSLPAAAIEKAQPSAFASTMFGRGSIAPVHQLARSLFTLPYSANSPVQTTDAFAGPSPDDVVIAAQSKAAAAKARGPPKTSGEKRADQIANGVEAMKIDDTPRAKSKNLDVLAEFKKSKAKNAANFVVIGHVDAGKSTLMGRLLYDLNVVDKRTIDKYRKEAEAMGKSSFALAWILDQGTEERSRGVTIDIATNKFETDKTTFTILDAPGHRDFIPNMIAGASQADFAVLVVDASTGSFESGLKGQTKEHALLVRSMGVQRLIIAVNKLDTVYWSEERFDEISQQVSAFLINAGFLPKNITFIPMSGLNGDNITRRSTEPAASWYTGPTLVEALDASEPVTRALDKPLRLTIGDIFRGGVQNPLSVSGRIESGSLQAGDPLVTLPANQKCFIKAIEVDNDTVDWAVAGQNITLHLSDIDPVHLRVGDVLCSPSSPISCLTRFTAKVLAFEFLMPMGVDVHRGRLHAPGKIVEIVAVLDKASGTVTKRKPRIVKPGSICRVVVEVDEKVPLETGLRVVLRSGGETVGAGLLE